MKLASPWLAFVVALTEQQQQGGSNLYFFPPSWRGAIFDIIGQLKFRENKHLSYIELWWKQQQFQIHSFKLVHWNLDLGNISTCKFTFIRHFFSAPVSQIYYINLSKIKHCSRFTCSNVFITLILSHLKNSVFTNKSFTNESV